MNVVDPPQLGRAVPEATIVHPAKDRVPTPKRGRFVAWVLIWSLAIVYGSVVVGPLGFHYVPLESATAWARFMAMPYVVQGSDQQADWMGNLVFLIPLGFALAGAIWPRRGIALRIAAGIAAFCLCVGFILTVKYWQLYFPPRTVTLNYVFAQSLGSLVGILLYAAPRGWARRAATYFSQGDMRALQIYLWVYAVALMLFILFPLDFVFHAADLRARLADVPSTLMSWPGGGRSVVVRLILVTLDTAATVPLGVMAAVTWPRSSLPRLVALGFVAMAGIWLVTIFDMSATPYLAAILYRTLGIAVGVGLTRRLRRADVAALLRHMGRIVPVLVPVYVVAVLYVNRVLTTHFVPVDQALASFDSRLLLPFWNHYIVSKAQAAESTIVQLVTYAPIGIMVALWRNGRPGGAWPAAIAAAALSLAVETGRWLLPDLRPDFSNLFFAGVAAYAAARLMPSVWRFIEADRPARWTAAEPTTWSPAHAATEDDALPPAAAWRGAGDERIRPTPAHWIVAAACVALAGAIAMRYPIAPWALAGSLVIYGALLWRWPGAWLVAIPAMLPALDLTPWTGWIFLGEPDLFILATIGILAVRAPPARRDFILSGWPGRLLLLFVLVYCVNVAMGLVLPGPAGGSDNPFLRPDNALRLAKGCVEALALLPFLRARRRRHGDAAELFGWGMLAGLLAVGVVAAIERALFPGLFDFTSDYRIVATFSSMNLGGGHVGAYVAMALPFLIVCAIRPGPARIGAMLVVALIGGYTLVVTFARTAYAAALVGVAAAFVGSVLALRGGRRRSLAAAILPALLLIVVGGFVLAAVFGGTFMSERLETLGPDLGTREGNWTGGLALRGDGVVASALGMGLGTYPRIVLAKRDGARAPTDFIVVRDGDRNALSMRFGSAFYLIQHVPIEPDQRYKLTLRMRTPDGRGRLSALLCENMLLYSENCQAANLEPARDGAWTELSATLSSAGLAERRVLGLRRPVELSLSDPVPGSVIELESVRLLDPQGRDVVANGDFAAGLTRWFFSDDDHLVWRIKNQYLMTLFEGGAVGLGAFLVLALGGIVGAMRALLRGEVMAASFAAALVAFLCSSAFDYLLEAPRLAALFYLVAFIGLDLAPAKIMTNVNR